MAAIHFPEPTTAPPPEPTRLDVAEPEPRWYDRRRRLWVIGTILLAIAGVVAWLIIRPSSSVDQGPISTPSSTGFAELYLRAYLMDAGEGAEDVVAPYLGYAPDLTGVTAGTWYVADIAVIEVIDQAGTSTVILATDLLGAVSGGYSDAGTHFYAVEVVATDTGLLAVGLPSEVAGPAADTREVERPALAPPPDTPITAAVQDYLDWYLTGAEGAYEGARPELVYRSVTIRTMSTPDLSIQPAPVQLELLATDRQGRSTLLSYTLEVANQQGMWVAARP